MTYFDSDSNCNSEIKWMSTGSSTIFASFLFDRIKTYTTNDPDETPKSKRTTK